MSTIISPSVKIDNRSLHLLVDSVPQLIWIALSDGTVLYYNNRLGEYNAEAKAPDGTFHWEKLIHPEDMEATTAAWEKANATVSMYHHEHRLMMRDGSYRWHISRAFPQHDKDKITWYGSATDTHEQHEAMQKVRGREKELEDARTQLELAIQAGNIGIWLGDYVAGRIYWTPEQEAIYGLKTGEFQGTNDHWRTMVHPDDVERVENEMYLQMMEKKIPQSTFRIIRPGGEVRWIQAKVKVIYDEEGRIRYTYGVNLDITEQKLQQEELERTTAELLESERDLRDSERSLRTLVETLPHLVWVVDMQDKTQSFISRKWQEYTGIEKVSDEMFWTLLHPDDVPLISSRWQHSVDTGETYRAEARLKNKHGEYRWFQVHGEPVKDEQGNVMRWIGAYTDVQEQRSLKDQLENLVAERTRELLESQSALQTRNEQLVIANQELESMNYIASHDLQEPLRKIRTFISIMETKNGEKQGEYLEKIKGSAERMSDLIHDILEYRKLTHSDDHKKAVDLNEVLITVMKDYELLIQEKDADVQSDPLPVIMAIPFQMNQLFSNLLGNALKFNNAKPVIRIRAGIREGRGLDREFPGRVADGNYVQIRFEDNGIGFEKQYEEKIFILFQRLHNRSVFMGTGIGLALCRRITENHQGFIYAEGEPEKGARFTAILRSH